MPLRFSIGIGSLGDENLILLTSLKENFETKIWKEFRDFERDWKIKKAKLLDWDMGQNDGQSV